MYSLISYTNDKYGNQSQGIKIHIKNLVCYQQL